MGGSIGSGERGSFSRGGAHCRIDIGFISLSFSPSSYGGICINMGFLSTSIAFLSTVLLFSSRRKGTREGGRFPSKDHYFWGGGEREE